MKTKKITIFIAIIAILTCISTMCFATDTEIEATAEEQSETLETENSVKATDEEEILTVSEDKSQQLLSSSSYPEDYTVNNETTGITSDLEKFTGNYVQIGSDIDINKAINGNAFVIGNNVKVTGQINGDLFVLASGSFSIEYGSAIYGNVFVASPSVVMNGTVYNLFATTDTYTCKYNGMAALDLKVIAKNIEFEGYVERNVYFSAENITLNDDACILGNLNYSAKNYSQTESSIINGEILADDYKTTSTNPIAQYTISFIASLTLLSEF